MPHMLYHTLFWRIHREYRMKRYQEKKCKKQFDIYLKYLETKDFRIKDYISIEYLIV